MAKKIRFTVYYPEHGPLGYFVCDALIVPRIHTVLNGSSSWADARIYEGGTHQISFDATQDDITLFLDLVKVQMGALAGCEEFITARESVTQINNMNGELKRTAEQNKMVAWRNARFISSKA
jgi:hypothetical protein